MPRGTLLGPRLSTCRPFLIPDLSDPRAEFRTLKKEAGPTCFLRSGSRRLRQLMQFRVCAPVPQSIAQIR